MTPFHTRIIAALQADAASDHAFVYGLVIADALPDGSIVDAAFWNSDDAMQVALIISEDGLTIATAERACTLVDMYEANHPDFAGMICAAVAIDGEPPEEDPAPVEGFELWELFGGKSFMVYGVSRKE